MSAAYGFRPGGAAQQTGPSNTPMREGHSAEYEVHPLFNADFLIQAPWPIYALDWVKWPHANLTRGGAIALGSFLEESVNKVFK